MRIDLKLELTPMSTEICLLDVLLLKDRPEEIEQELIQLLDSININNEIAKELDPRFKTLTEIEAEQRLLKALEAMPSAI